MGGPEVADIAEVKKLLDEQEHAGEKQRLAIGG
jgi:hypothetical protein